MIIQWLGLLFVLICKIILVLLVIIVNIMLIGIIYEFASCAYYLVYYGITVESRDLKLFLEVDLLDCITSILIAFLFSGLLIFIDIIILLYKG